jgi:hypothetical protein
MYGNRHTRRNGLPDPNVAIMIRRATADDAGRLRDLAVLDAAPPVDVAALLDGDVLVAEVDGELWAARLLTAERTLSDPFRPSRHARELLDVRAKAFRRVGSSRSVLRRARGILGRSAPTG